MILINNQTVTEYPAIRNSNHFENQDADFIVVVRFEGIDAIYSVNADFIVVVRFEGIDAIYSVNPDYTLAQAREQAFELTRLSYGMTDEQATDAISVSVYSRS